MKIGTIEPKYTDTWNVYLLLDGENGPFGRSIMDESLAFIYGAIAKYAWRPTYINDEEYRNSLKEYIIKMADKIGDRVYTYDEGKEPSEDEKIDRKYKNIKVKFDDNE